MARANMAVRLAAISYLAFNALIIFHLIDRRFNHREITVPSCIFDNKRTRY
jgi:hypothetical protein